MLRPALYLALCVALGGDPCQRLYTAHSFEQLHRTSLVFDDIQDRSSQRNHRATICELRGVDQGINTGLSPCCFSRLSLHRMLDDGVPPSTVLEVYRLLEETVVDLGRGQYLDLDFRERILSLDEYREMVRLKT